MIYLLVFLFALGVLGMYVGWRIRPAFHIDTYMKKKLQIRIVRKAFTKFPAEAEKYDLYTFKRNDNYVIVVEIDAEHDEAEEKLQLAIAKAKALRDRWNAGEDDLTRLNNSARKLLK